MMYKTGDIVGYWWPTGEYIDDVTICVGKITGLVLDPSSHTVKYNIDYRRDISEKNIFPMFQDNPAIKKVIFNPPATIVLWTDGTKTVVKAAEGDEYSKWAGLALCMAKKQLGEDFYKVFKKWCKEDEEEEFNGYENPFLDALYRSFLPSYHNAPVTEKEEEKNEKGE